MNEERLWTWVGIAAGGAALWQWWRKGNVVETLKRAEEAAVYEGSLSQEAPGVGGLEQAAGAAARIFGLEEPPKITDVPDRPAEESKGPFLGTPKNLLRVAGKMRWPGNGSRVNVSWGTSTIEADAAIENQSTIERVGQVRARLVERKGTGQEQTITDGPVLRLAPGELRSLLLRVPLAYSGYGSDPDSSQLSLLFENHTLDTTVFSRT